MHDPAGDLVREWLTRAENDLRVARYLLTMPTPPPESIGFHAQQCAEKAIKGFLTQQQARFGRRHDLNYLIDLCVFLDPGFEQFRSGADQLTPYVVEYRYPDALPLMPLGPAALTVDIAEGIYSYVLNQLGFSPDSPPDAHAA